MVNSQAILAKLKSVIDPELGINIVDLGFIYNVSLDDRKVSILMTLTSPGCPLAAAVEQMITEAVSEISGISEVAVQVTFDPPWAPDMMSEEAKAILGFD